MADSQLGNRYMVIDLTVATQREIVSSTAQNATGRRCILGIKVTGTSGAAAGTIILRSDSSTGPIFFQYTDPTAATLTNALDAYTPTLSVDGIFLDGLGTAWATGARCIIYLA